MTEQLKEQIIQIRPDDEIATIRDCLTWADARRVVLVVPRRNKAMRDKMNLKLVQRTAVDQAIQLALVAHHRDTVRLAREIGLPVFWLANGGLTRHNWNGGAAPVFVPDEDGDELKILAPTESLIRKDYRLVSAIVFGAIMLLLGGIVLLLAPTAKVTLSPVSEETAVSLEIVANPSAKTVNTAVGQIPARVEELQLDGTEKIVPIAKKDVPDARATGSVVFTNKSDQLIHIPKGSYVATSAGVPIRFQTTSDVDLQARGRAEAPIAALEPGPTGNVAKFAINTAEGQFGLVVNAINQNATGGGTVKRVPVVSDEDKRRLEEMLAKRLRQEAITQLQAKYKENEFVAPESVSVALDSKTFDKFVDEPADVLTLSAHATAKGTIVNGENANIVALKRLESKLRAGFELLPDSIEFIPGAVLGVEKDSVRFEMQVKGRAAASIDRASVAGSLRGMTVPQAEDWLHDKISLRRDPLITLNSDWLRLGRLPFFDFRIQVDVVQ